MRRRDRGAARARYGQARGAPGSIDGDAPARRDLSWRRRRRRFASTCCATRLAAERGDATDEAALAERAGHHVRLVEGDPAQHEDHDAATISSWPSACSRAASRTPVMRIGNGYDLHRLVAGPAARARRRDDPVREGAGGALRCGRGLSRGDRRDSRRAGAGDIGRHFPGHRRRRGRAPTASSCCARAAAIVRDAGFAWSTSTSWSSRSGRSWCRTSARCARNLARRAGRRRRRRSASRARPTKGVDSMGAGESIAVHAVALWLSPGRPDPTRRLSCEFASPRARPGSCTSATRARRSSTGCWRAGRGGTFILRIEDTDVERSTRESERAILEDLRWLGLEWDEGVDEGGDHGPYRQSERLHIYRAHAVELLSAGTAYRCFCSPEQLETDRQAALARAGRRSTSGAAARSPRDDGAAALESGEPAVDPFPRARSDATSSSTTSSAARCGSAPTSSATRCSLRSDGVPAYNFAVVIDDALMGITHVIRGEDHISNTPRQLLLYEAFGWTPPRLRARLAGDGAGSQPAVEAPRRDVGRRVPRARLPARGADQLPRADRVVAGRGPGARCRSTSWRARFRSRTSGTAPACSTSRSWRG